jgi:hypothetical protein
LVQVGRVDLQSGVKTVFVIAELGNEPLHHAPRATVVGGCRGELYQVFGCGQGEIVVEGLHQRQLNLGRRAVQVIHQGQLGGLDLLPKFSAQGHAQRQVDVGLAEFLLPLLAPRLGLHPQLLILPSGWALTFCLNIRHLSEKILVGQHRRIEPFGEREFLCVGSLVSRVAQIRQQLIHIIPG